MTTREKVIELLEATSTLSTNYQRLMSQLEEVRPVIIGIIDDLPLANKFIDDFKQLATADFPSLKNRLIDTFLDNMSEEEVDAYLAFYSTPLGKSIASKANIIQAECDRHGKEWGKAISDQLVKKIEQLS